MKIEHVEMKRCDLFRIGGRIDGAAAPEFEMHLRRVLDVGRYHLIVNLGDVSFLSSAGLRVLISALKECRRYNRGDVRLSQVPERVSDVLVLAGLDELFKTFANDAEAVGSY